MANTVTINNIPSNFLELQDYSIQDDNLITNSTVQTTFDPLQNYVSYFIYNINNELIYSNEAGFSGWSFINGQVYLDPQTDLERVGYTIGEYNTLYLFLNNETSSSIFNQYYIETISSDRTEIRLNTTQILNDNVVNGVNSLIDKIQTSTLTYFDFYLNFGENQLVIANNILLDNSDPNDPTVLIKLYEPLPINFTLKDECWIVTQVAEPIAYNININEIFEPVSDFTYLKGPNLNLNIKDQINNSTNYTNYSTLSSSSYATGSTNLQYQINSILAERGVEINVDYSDYSNFIYFSSALTRLENFYYKLQLIEEYSYSASLSNLAGSSAQIITSKNIWEEKINEIITTFDGYDYFLYYESGSASWPKTNSIYPYNNATTNSVAGLTFIQSQSLVAADYDENNNNALINAIPTYLREDSANAQYELFIEMLGEMFDNIWIYYQDVTEKWNADNRLQYGVSKDIVADVLRDLGLKIYESSFGSADLYTALLGVTPSGNLFPFPYMTGSLPAPTGFEYINSSISASNQVVPLEDIEKGTYKRLYHNLPMLLKKKGTTVGIQDLVTTYGIPSTILRVAEFGGKDKDESNDWDYYKQRYNYYADAPANKDSIISRWQLNSDWNSSDDIPNTIQFRFKLPSSGSSGAVNNAINTPSQSLWVLNDNTDSYSAIVLEYTGSGLTSGSYSGSIIDPYYQYGTLKFIPNLASAADSASIYLPFFDGEWWSVMISRTGSQYFDFYAANSIYNGDDGSTIGFIGSSSAIVNDSSWISSPSSKYSYFPGWQNPDTFGGKSYTGFSGSYQEIRYYTVGLSSSVFEDYTMNPDSIEGNSLNSAPDQLAFRASLGGELFTGSVSIHPKVTGSWVATSSFASNSDFILGGSVTFASNIETVYLDQPAAGIKNIVSNKIQIVDMNLPSGSTLSQYRSIQQQPPGGSTYTENLAYTEIAFSPQNEINDDIMDQLGFFNMGEFIGDPRQRFNQDTSYPDLDALRNAYFEKYVSNYDLNDYIRLIKFFDNSLFKMIKDFTPARSSLASGVVVKQTLLERNKYPQPEVEWARYDYSGSIYTINGWDPETEELIQTSRNIVIPTGGAGGSVNNLNNLDTNPYYVDNVYGVTQSWQETFVIPSGIVTQTHDSQDEFYNGEFSGSNFVVENGELNTECDPYKKVNTEITDYNISHTTNNDNGQFFFPQQQVNLSIFLSDNVLSGVPVASGEMWTWWNATRTRQRIGGNTVYYDVYQIEYIKISKTSGNGVNLEDYISSTNQIRIPSIIIDDSIVSIGGWTDGTYISLTNNSENYIDLNVINITEYTNYYLLRVIQSNGYQFTITSQGTGFVDASTPAPITITSDPNTQIVIEPFVPVGFYNSDCNPLINNYEFNRLSDWRQQVDYATDQNIPVNFQQIISGTAYPASVQDSNYTSYQYSGIRYIGSKNTTDNFNNASTIVSREIENQTNTDLGNTTLGLPSVNLNRTYFSYFNWAGGSSPEWGNINEDKTVYSIRFFIDESGSIIRPLNSPDGIALGIMRQNFTEGENAVSSLLNTNISSYAVSVLNGTYPIFKSGKTVQPILYSQTQSASGNTILYGYTGSLDFNVQIGSGVIPNYGFQAYNTANQTSTNIPAGVTNNIVIEFDTAAYNYTGNYNTTSDKYVFSNDTSASVSFRAFIRHTFDFAWETPDEYYAPNQSATIQFAIQSGSGTTWTDLATKNVLVNIYTTGIIETTFATPFRLFNSGDEIRVVMKTYSVTPNPFNDDAGMSFLANSYFNNSQTQGGFTVPTASIANGDYWVTGSSSRSILTASLELTSLYSYKQNDVSGSGFNSINYPFEIQPYDEIRFEAIEANTYTIISSSYTNRLHLFLDKDITPINTDLNFFLLRRYVDDPAFLILDVDKPAGASGGGIIKPEFLAEDIDQNINQIVQDLEERGLLPTQ
jgi:hypothetical protein